MPVLLLPVDYNLLVPCCTGPLSSELPALRFSVYLTRFVKPVDATCQRANERATSFFHPVKPADFCPYAAMYVRIFYYYKEVC